MRETKSEAVGGPSHDAAGCDRPDEAAFVARFGAVFEHSPWVAQRAWQRRPFADAHAVHAAMVAVVREADAASRRALLRAHPELWGPEARARQMTADSLHEQGRAGLLALSPQEAQRIDALNAAHRQKFGFPFIIAVMNYTREQIFVEFERRLALDVDEACAACLEQVFEITRLRMRRLAAQPGPASGGTP